MSDHDEIFGVRSDDSSLFETAADFFSLVGLAAIYSVVTFGAQSGRSSDISVQEGDYSGPAQVAMSNILYMSIEPSGDAARITVIHPSSGEVHDRLFLPDETSIDSALAWADDEITGHGDFAKVRLRLDSTEERPMVIKVFMTILRKLQGRGLVVEAGV